MNKKRGSLIQAFRAIDKSGNNLIDYNEFYKALKGRNFGLSEAEIQELWNSIDKRDRDEISYLEFIRRFDPSFGDTVSSAREKRDVPDELSLSQSRDFGRGTGRGTGRGGLADSFARASVKFVSPQDTENNICIIHLYNLFNLLVHIKEKVKLFLHKSGLKMSNFFLDVASKTKGRLDLDGFDSILAQVGVKLPIEETKAVFDQFDANKSGFLTYEEFSQEFSEINSILHSKFIYL